MRVLVTGATGFIGCRATQALLERGHEVIALVPVPELERAQARFGEQPRCTLHPGSLAEPNWEPLLRCRPDAVLHCAWVTTPGVYLQSPLNHAFLDWSREFFRRLAEAGVLHLVGVGSCAEYTLAPKAVRLAVRAAPAASLYAESKDQLRVSLATLAQRVPTCRTSWARVFYPYGRGEPEQKLATATIRALRRGERFAVKSPEEAKDFIHVEDVGNALATVVEAPAGNVLDIGTGAPCSVREFVSTIARLLGMVPDQVFQWGTAGDPISTKAADTADLRALGWRPRLTLEAGLRDLLDYVKEQT